MTHSDHPFVVCPEQDAAPPASLHADDTRAVARLPARDSSPSAPRLHFTRKPATPQGAEALAPETPHDTRLHYLTHRASYVGGIAHLCFIPLFALSGHPLLAWFNVLSVAAWFLGYRLNAMNRQAAALLTLSGEVLGHAVLATTVLGWTSGFQFYLIALIPYILFYSRGSDKLLIGGASLVLLTMVGLYFTSRETPNGLLPSLQDGVYVMNLLVPMLVLGMVSLYYRRASIDAEVRMEQLATRDALTGLFNRRMMNERLSQERGRTSRGAATFSLVMCDIDHFKEINDTLGHDRGDEVLVEVASRFQQALRQQDIIARWGGEEFLILLPDTDSHAAEAVTERLRASLGEAALELREFALSVTASFGATTFEPGSRLADVLRTVDEALYEAKAGGRNRVSLRPSGTVRQASRA